MSTVAEELAEKVSVTDREAFEYLINEVLGEPGDDKPVWSALNHEGIGTWKDLLCLNELDIDELRYTLPRKPPNPLVEATGINSDYLENISTILMSLMTVIWS